MRNLNTVMDEMSALIVAGTHRVRFYPCIKNPQPGAAASRTSLFVYCHEGTITVDESTETWSMSGTTFNYTDTYVVFCASLAECQKFENTNGKFTALICVDVSTKKVYTCSRNNEDVVSLVRLYSSPFTKRESPTQVYLRSDTTPEYDHTSSALGEGEVAYDYTS